MSRPSVVVIGDVVLDRDISGDVDRVCPDAPAPVVDVGTVDERPGGAGLAARLCAAGDVDVTLVAPLAADGPGRRLAAMLRSELAVVPLPHEGPTRHKTRVLSGGQVVVRLDGGGPGAPVDPPLGPVGHALRAADVVLVSDYGGGVTRDERLRGLLAEAARYALVVWDPHPRGGVPVPGTVVTPNLAEARAAAGRAQLPWCQSTTSDGVDWHSGPVGALAAALCEHWHARALCVTAGADGAYLALPGREPEFLPTPFPASGDSCGAGDRFAASVAYWLARGRLLTLSFTAAVAEATLWVAAGGVGTRPSTRSRGSGAGVDEVVADVRERGGTVVATGGCFDLLHAGHVACLEAARKLGDALVVLINSDESVRRLKGPGRPVMTAADRSRVLLSLGCVDGVLVFDGDDPGAVLDKLRPDVWVKGGDYNGVPLPEGEIVRSWGGRVVLVPYLDGHSTTSILRRSTRARAEEYQEAG